MSSEAPPPPTQRIVFWASMAAGAVIVLIGLNGLRTAPLIDRPMISGGIEVGTLAKFFVGGALVVDLIVIPLGAGIGWLAKRVVPTKAWPAVRAGLFTSAILLIYSYALVFDKGGKPGLDSLRPRNYSVGLVLALVATWLVSLAVAAVMVVRDPVDTAD